MGMQVPRPTSVMDSLSLGRPQESEFQQAFQLILLEVSALHLEDCCSKAGHTWLRKQMIFITDS